MQFLSEFYGFVCAHPQAILIILLALSGLLSQVAARFDLGWLASASTTLGWAVQQVAGNAGYAKNAVDVAKTYRDKGADAAINELAALLPPPPRAG